ncbi:MAG: hypothetical protein GX946_07155 [Oligosphaeraceae bacterium]|nr:hypothetical protein [Oligosphaeraceae bacterium]
MQLKNIRFNLKFSTGKNADGEEQFVVIRSIKDLEDNLNVDELYLYFMSGQLARWLTVIDEGKKAEAISKIDKKANINEQLKAIFSALDFKLDKDELAVLVESYSYSKLIQDQKRDMASILENVQEVIKQDFARYTHCLNDIIASATDFGAVKAKVRALLKNFPEQFSLDWKRFYDLMIFHCPLAIFVVLMNEKYRNFFLVDEANAFSNFYNGIEVLATSDDGKTKESNPKQEHQINDPIRYFVERFSNLLTVHCSNNQPYIILDANCSNQRFDEGSYLMKDNLIIKEVDYSKSEGEWQDAVDKGNKVMILHCGNNVTIRPSGDKEHQYKGEDQLPPFAIFNGLDFRTSSSYTSSRNDVLMYMEV